MRLRRCHTSSYGATEFNARAGTPGRFRPIRAGRRVVPTLYAADLPAGALSETVLHDVPVETTVKRVRASRFDTVLLSTIAPTRDLRLIRLHGHGFHRLKVSRAKLIESEADCYPELAALGQALHDCPAAADGLLWRSRHYDDSYACLLFGDRVRRRELRVLEPSLPLALGRGFELLQELAEAAGITLVRVGRLLAEAVAALVGSPARLRSGEAVCRAEGLAPQTARRRARYAAPAGTRMPRPCSRPPSRSAIASLIASSG